MLIMSDSELQNYFINWCSVDGNVIKITGPILDRANYNQVKKLLESRGGKWKGSSVSGFVFDSDVTATEVITSICCGDLENKKQRFQFFATPDELADRMVEKLNINILEERPVRILEPSAGKGALICAIHRKFPELTVDAYEINPDCFESLKNIRGVRLNEKDFLSAPAGLIYDYIIANPPFAKNADIKHFRKMYEMLKYGGRLVCILSERAIDCKFRQCVEFSTWLRGLNVISLDKLPAGTFRTSGTETAAYMVCIEK